MGATPADPAAPAWRAVLFDKRGPHTDDFLHLGAARVGPGRLGSLPTRGSGEEAALPPPPPLRTAREGFPSCSSSLANAPRGTRLTNGSTLAMDLLMAGRMHEHAVLDRVFAPMGSPPDVMVMPPRQCGDLL